MLRFAIIYATMAAEFAKAKAAIDARATMKVRKGKAHYTSKMAKKGSARGILRRRYCRQRIPKGGWSLEDDGARPVRARVKLATHRSNGGFMKYQVPGEPWCQVRAYGFSEQAKKPSARPKFKKVKGVNIEWVRFEKCR